MGLCKLNELNTYILDDDINKYILLQSDFDNIMTTLDSLLSSPPLKSQDGGFLKKKYKVKYTKF